MTAPAGKRRQERQRVQQVRPEQPEVPSGGMLGEDRRLQHDGVQREHAGMVGDDQSRPAIRDAAQPSRLNPEPAPVERKCRRHQHGRVQLGIEPELVDLELAGQAPPGELGRTRGPHTPARRSGRPGASHCEPFIADL